MATITIKKELQDFLEKEGILEAFIENVTRDYIKWGITQESNDEEEDIETAFIFDETEQGHKYWKDISNKWENYKLKNGIKQPILTIIIMYTYQTKDGQEITISTRTYSKDTKTGFSHYCELRITNETTGEGFEIGSKCVYYNRTWESYRYQTVMQVAVQKAMKSTKSPALLDALKNYYETL